MTHGGVGAEPLATGGKGGLEAEPLALAIFTNFLRKKTYF